MSRCSFPVLLVLLVIATGGPVCADEREPKSLAPVVTVGQVLSAFEAKDEKALAALAARDEPDPWVTADTLCAQGEFDAAEAFAKAALRRDTRDLPAYVAASRDRDDDGTVRFALDSSWAAFSRRDHESVLNTLGHIEVDDQTVVGLRVLYLRGVSLSQLFHLEKSEEVFLRAAKASEELGWIRQAAQLTQFAGMVNHIGSRYDHALVHYQRWRELEEQRKRPPHEIAEIDLKVGLMQHNLSAYREALASFEKGRDAFETAEFVPGIARACGHIGMTYGRLGRYGKALAFHHRALELYRDPEDLAHIAATEINVGLVQHDLADYAKAIWYYERGISHALKAKAHNWVANGLANLAGVYHDVGIMDKAYAYAMQALKQMQMLHDRSGASAMLIGIGLIKADEGKHAEALELYSAALSEARALKSPQRESEALSNMAQTFFQLEKYDDALKHYLDALEIQTTIGDRANAANTMASVGKTLIATGDIEGAKASIEKSLRSARRLRLRRLAIRNLASLARIHLHAGEPETALGHARVALAEVERLFGGLGEEEAIGVRARHADIFGIGALTAAQLDDPAEALTFLESGRAGALLEHLGGRDAIRFAAFSDNLRDAEAEARRIEVEAREVYQEAVLSGSRKALREATMELESAVAGSRIVIEKIQRDAKRQAFGLVYPNAAPIEEVQDALEEDQALIVYGLCYGRALALLVTHETASIVELGSSEEVAEACRSAVFDDASRDDAEHIASLEKLLVEPLTIPDGVEEIIVSPQGPLCYVPYATVFDTPVALSPSGTTHVLLREEMGSKRGEGVLAVGNPDYGLSSDGARGVFFRGKQLTPLPATAVEAKEVGTDILLGKDANEAALVNRLGSKPRWRAVHFACHGLLNPDHATMSALALSPTDGDDGFLTALEVLRMEIPADLAVLSACDTGRQGVVEGEGIIGMTRAFMFAGAPRVICSLWRVDDKATKELMTKFYELWNPKAPEEGTPQMSAAEALRRAQMHVRSQPQWEHPYYWAAWVLWGLPR